MFAHTSARSHHFHTTTNRETTDARLTRNVLNDSAIVIDL